jgi:hypothetical protein
MALVTTSVTPTVRITPFTGLSQTARERSGIARAEETHSSYGIWPATGTGDNRGLIFSWDLNPDYGYVLMDCTCAFLRDAGSITMEATGFMEIGTDLGPGASDKERQHYQLVSHPSRQDSANTATDSSGANYNSMQPAGTDVGAMIFNMPIKPSGLLFPFPGVTSIEIATVFGELPTNKVAVAYRFFCRFLQYDITQGYNYVISSPRLTR